VPLAADGRDQVALALVGVAALQDVARPLDQHLQRVAGPAKLALDQDHGHRVEPAAAQLGGHVRGVEPGGDRLRADLPGQLGRDLVQALHLVLVRVEFLLHERADGVHDEPLLVGESEIHYASPKAGRAAGVRMVRPT